MFRIKYGNFGHIILDFSSSIFAWFSFNYRYFKEKSGLLPETDLISIFIKHTSAALTLNENSDIFVRSDMDKILNKLMTENQNYYTKTLVGSDDMYAHVKSSLIGNSVSIPVSEGKMNIGGNLSL